MIACICDKCKSIIYGDVYLEAVIDATDYHICSPECATSFEVTTISGHTVSFGMV